MTLDRILNALGILAVVALLGLGLWHSCAKPSIDANDRIHEQRKAHPVWR